MLHLAHNALSGQLHTGVTTRLSEKGAMAEPGGEEGGGSGGGGGGGDELAISCLPGLRELDVSDNQLGGHVPDWILGNDPHMNMT